MRRSGVRVLDAAHLRATDRHRSHAQFCERRGRRGLSGSGQRRRRVLDGGSSRRRLRVPEDAPVSRPQTFWERTTPMLRAGALVALAGFLCLGAGDPDMVEMNVAAVLPLRGGGG